MVMQMSVELKMLLFTIILGLLQLLAATQASTAQRGLKWNFSPRDQKLPELNGVAGRLDRAFKNLMETFPFFIAAILMVQVLGRSNSLSVLGSELFFGARLIYVPLYATGILVIRTLVWLVSLIGLCLVLSALI